MKTAAIIIPSYNESGSIEKLIQEIFSIADTLPKWILHIWIVDSHSSDQTDLIVKRLMDKYKNLHLLETKKEGLGKAYIAGFRAALDSINPYVLFEMDGDGSHLPKYIPQFLEKIEKGADFVIGSRYMKGGSIPSDWGLHRKIFSVCANIFVKFGFMKLKISDWTSGYRAIKSWIIRAELSYVNRYSGYVFQVALLDKAVTKGANIDQIPIQFIDRIAGRSKINAAQYITHTITYVITHSSFIKFSIVGGIGFIVDFSFAYLFINGLHIAKSIANMMSAEVAIIGNFFLNNFWSFNHKKVTGGISGYIRKFSLFNFTSVGSIIIQGAGMAIALRVFGDHVMHTPFLSFGSWIVYKVVIILTLVIPYSYIIYNKFIWKDR